MLRDLLLMAYVGAVGFVSAGTVASFYRLLTSQPPRFGLLGTSMAGWLTSFLFLAVIGPVIMAGHTFRVRRERYGIGMVVLGMTITGLWSCCLGVFVLQLALALADTFA